jgi:hypothetical protein
MNDEQIKQMNKHNEELAKLRSEKANKPKTHREKQKERKRH